MIAVQKSCIHASAVAVFVEWWIVVFVDNVSFYRGICTLGAIFIDSNSQFKNNSEKRLCHSLEDVIDLI